MKLVEKLIKAQSEIEPTVKGSKNPHFRSDYASLDELLGVVKPVLNTNGLFLTQANGRDEKGDFVETNITDGVDAVQSRMYLVGHTENMQKFGAATTYGRRYTLSSLLALETADDDGESLVGRTFEPKPKAAASAPRPQSSFSVAPKAPAAVITQKAPVEAPVTVTVAEVPVDAVLDKQAIIDTGIAIQHKIKELTEQKLLDLILQKYKLKTRTLANMAELVVVYKRHDVAKFLSELLTNGRIAA